MLIYRFRNCLLNTIERSVIKGDQHVELTTKTFDVLLYLIENAGKIVTKDELLGAVWGGDVVEESNLPVHISKLRRSLGETRFERYVETVQGIGYRFVAPVETVERDIWQSTLFLATHLRRPGPLHRGINDSIAVMPLVNESESEDIHYIADGLTETFINKLSLVPNLKVIARNSVFRYKNKSIDSIEVGEILGAGTVLSGRVRIVGNELIVSVELVSVRDGRQVWGELFHEPMDKIVTIQEAIVASVTEKLRSSESRARYAELPSGTRNPESYKAYLKGDYFLAKRTAGALKKAIGCFTDAISHDSSNVHARVKAAECYRVLYIMDSISFATAVDRITPFLANLSQSEEDIDAVQLMLGKISAQLYWNVEAAEGFIGRAIELNPNSVDANLRYAEILLMTDRATYVPERINRVLDLDPFSLPTYKFVARLLYHLGNYEGALDYLRDSLEMEPGDYEALALLGGVLTELGDSDHALVQFHNSLAAHPTVDVLAMIGYVEALRGRKATAARVIREIVDQSKGEKKYPLKLARIYMALGEKDTMYRLLDEALGHREIELCGLMYDPRWRAVKGERRFIDFANRVRLLGKETARP